MIILSPRSCQLSHISPQIISDLTEHFQGKGMLERVEACIVHLDILSLDIHQVCRLHLSSCPAQVDSSLYLQNSHLSTCPVHR